MPEKGRVRARCVTRSRAIWAAHAIRICHLRGISHHRAGGCNVTAYDDVSLISLKLDNDRFSELQQCLFLFLFCYLGSQN